MLLNCCFKISVVFSQCNSNNCNDCNKCKKEALRNWGSIWYCLRGEGGGLISRKSKSSNYRGGCVLKYLNSKSKFSMRSSNFAILGEGCFEILKYKIKVFHEKFKFWRGVALRPPSPGPASNFVTKVSLAITIWSATLFHKIGKTIISTPKKPYLLIWFYNAGKIYWYESLLHQTGVKLPGLKEFASPQQIR